MFKLQSPEQAFNNFSSKLFSVSQPARWCINICQKVRLGDSQDSSKNFEEATKQIIVKGLTDMHHLSSLTGKSTISFW